MKLTELFEIQLEIGDCLVALESILRKGFRNDSLELRRYVRNVLHERNVFMIDDRNARVAFSLSLEWMLSRDHLVKQHAQTENVCPFIDGIAEGLLGRHVTAGAHDGAGIRFRDRYG